MLQQHHDASYQQENMLQQNEVLAANLERLCSQVKLLLKSEPTTSRPPLATQQPEPPGAEPSHQVEGLARSNDPVNCRGVSLSPPKNSNQSSEGTSAMSPTCKSTTEGTQTRRSGEPSSSSAVRIAKEAHSRAAKTSMSPATASPPSANRVTRKNKDATSLGAQDVSSTNDNLATEEYHEPPPHGDTSSQFEISQAASTQTLDPDPTSGSSTKALEPVDSDNFNPPQQPPSSVGQQPQARWTSNKQTRQFMNEEAAVPRPPYNTQAPIKSWLTARGPASKETLSFQKPVARQDSLWDEEPGFAYKETVRCRAHRQGMPAHDCEQCREFYQVLKDTGHDFSQDPISTNSRHRSRFPPSETPEGFWDVDFHDEVQAERAGKPRRWAA